MGAAAARGDEGFAWEGGVKGLRPGLLEALAKRYPPLRPGRKRGDRGTCKRCGAKGHYAKTCGRPARVVVQEPVPTRPKRIRRPRENGQNHCAICGGLGHTRARHESQAPSVVAARMVAEQGLTLAAAGEQFQVTRQAVQRALRIHFGDVLTATQEKRHIAHLRAATLALAGKTTAEIAVDAGMGRQTVYRALRARGIKARNPWNISEDEIAAAADLVANGASYMEAAVEVGRGAQRLADHLREIGVPSRASNAPRMDGRIKRAIARVEAGESVASACAAEKCAATAVYTHFKRKREAGQ